MNSSNSSQKEGWVEHDPIEIWKTQLKAIKDVIKL
jgi:Glycerol kinase